MELEEINGVSRMKRLKNILVTIVPVDYFIFNSGLRITSTSKYSI